MQKNLQIRNAAKQHRIPLWQIAEKLGLSDSHFSRKLRKEFSDDDRAHIMTIIMELSSEDGT